MKIREIPVKRTFSQFYLPTPRSRRERKVGFVKEVMMQVPEISESEFPVAFIVHCEGQPDIEIRVHDDRLYRRGYCLDEFVRNQTDDSAYVYRDRAYAAKDAFVEGVSVITGDTVEVGTQALNEGIYKDVRLFGDQCWVKTDEPRYCISTFGLGHNHGHTSLSIDWSSYRSAYGNSFNALDRDRAIREAKDVARLRGDTNSIELLDRSDMIEVLMPEMVRYNPIMVGNITENLCEELLRTKSPSADTVIRDILDGRGPDGLGADILKCWLNAWKYDSERGAVDGMFEILTGTTMKDFIERAYRDMKEGTHEA